MTESASSCSCGGRSSGRAPSGTASPPTPEPLSTSAPWANLCWSKFDQSRSPPRREPEASPASFAGPPTTPGARNSAPPPRTPFSQSSSQGSDPP
eukprot:CAMPEP_0180304838 /NCGR_PEP_ID=MMETSP0988-20121125/26033_1 /TAXON_ID=697907 /ORGANISM="non described non described, Strain CCMP2293" /LENGTH=94 /DNA_ID=CAMNT_0022287085 /DNA_START=51 /DNA_END=331 /DNA_ORIENTATION=-